MDVFAIARALARSPCQGARGQTTRRRHAGRGLHDHEPGRHRRHGVHAHHQRARGRDPRRVEGRDEAGVEGRRVRAAPDAAAVVLVRSSRHRRRAGRAHREVPRRDAGQSPASCSRRCREQDRSGSSGSRQFRRGRRRRCADQGRRQGRSRYAARHARNRQGDHGRAVHGHRHRHRSAGEEGRQDRQGRCDRARRRRGPRRPAAAKPATSSSCRAGCEGAAPAPAPAAQRPAAPPPAAEALDARSSPTCRTIARRSCWCSAPGPAATRPRSAPRISDSRSRWSSAGRCWAASASTSAAFRRRRCCTRPRSSTKSARCARTASISARRRSTCPSCSSGRTGSSASWSAACRCSRSSARSRWCRASASSPARMSSKSQRADGKTEKIRFEQCIIAAGSEPIKLPFIPDDPRVIDSTGALELSGVPQATAGHRRRHHRPRDGHRVCLAGREALGGRAHAAAHAGRRSGSGPAAGEAPQGALRADPAEHEGHRLHGEA